jgi:hypothetical protein
MYKFRINSSRIEVSTIIFILDFFSLHILDRLDLNFNAINLTFLQIVDHEAVYNR